MSAAITDEALENLRRWGGSRELDAFESVMWLAEADPRLSSTTTSVLVLDRAPEWARVVAGHRWLVAAAPRFRQRIVVPALGLGALRWSTDPRFELEHHLRRREVAAPGDDRALFDLAALPFDRDRSPWEATLIEGLSGGRAAYVLKLHHATADGLGIMQLLANAASPTREERPRRLLAEEPDESPATPLDLALESLRRTSEGFPARALEMLRDVADTAAGALADPATTREYLESAGRMLGPTPVPGSPVFSRRSLARRFDAIEIALDDLKTASKCLGGSVNDVFLAGLIGGFRRYHEEMGFPPRDMPIGFPISIRSASDGLGGNRFTGTQYAAPVREPDPRKRIAHVRDFVRRVRAEPALDVTPRLMPLLVHLPVAAISRLMAGFTGALDAQISNIPGLSGPVHMAGAEITHFWPFARVPGCGMMIAMISHAGRCCIGINSDRSAVTEPEILTACLREGIGETLAAR